MYYSLTARLHISEIDFTRAVHAMQHVIYGVHESSSHTVSQYFA